MLPWFSGLSLFLCLSVFTTYDAKYSLPGQKCGKKINNFTPIFVDYRFGYLKLPLDI